MQVEPNDLTMNKYPALDHPLMNKGSKKEDGKARERAILQGHKKHVKALEAVGTKKSR